MILYCAVLPVMLFPMVLHKIEKNNDKEAVLLIDKSMYESRHLIGCVEKIADSGIFKSAIVINAAFPQKADVSDEVYSVQIVEYFDRKFDKNKYKLDDFEKIYTTNDTWKAEINLYFNLKQVEYTWVEVAQNNILDNFFNGELSKKYLFYSPLSKYAHPEILNVSANSKNVLDAKNCEYITWDKNKALKDMSDINLEKLIHCFHVDIKDDFKKSALLVLNSFGFSESILSSSYEVKLYNGEILYSRKDFYSVLSQIALDFYVPENKKVYVKTHPHDPIEANEAKMLFGEKTELLTDAPFELIIEYFSRKNINFDIIVGYRSTSLELLEEKMYNQSFLLGTDFLKTWTYYSSLLISLMLLAAIKFKKAYTHAYIKSQLEQMNEIYDLNADFFDLDQNNRSMPFSDSAVIINMSDDRYINGMYPELENISPTNMIIFINADTSPGFFEKKYMPYFTPVKIRKMCSEITVTDIHRDETIWVYSTDPEVHKKIRAFSYNSTLSRTGITLNVEKGSFNHSMELFERKFNDIGITRSLKHISDDNIALDRRLHTVTEYALNSAIQKHDTATIAKLMKSESDFSSYLDILKIIIPHLLVVLAVKDTPGNMIPNDILKRLHDIGFSALTTETWRMYIGAFHNGTELFNKSGESVEQPVVFGCEINDTKLTAESHPWRGKNVAKIVINDKDYAVNSRGINVVVYDIVSGQPLDSVAYDAHYRVDKFIHKLL